MSDQTMNTDDYSGSPSLSYANVEWNEHGQPVSSHFNDVYFSKASGIEETRYIFLAHNQLTERFKNLDAQNIGKPDFVIGETGFGTGLNFLCAWQLFEQYAPEHGHLHYISTEKYPLTTADLEKALALWPELSDYSQALLSAYIPATPGFHHLVFAQGKVRLTLLIGDVLETLPQMNAKVNAWFLDGFAPSKNPDMWQPQLFKTLAEKSASNATYATFTAARVVRDGLIQAGFSAKKTRGFGHKRDMLCGEFSESPRLAKATNKPWNDYPSPLHNVNSPHNTAVVIGGGLAGASCARALAERGWQITLLERHQQLATEASGNPQGILYAKLSAKNTPLSQLILQGYCYTLNKIKTLDQHQPGLQHTCGVIQLCTSDSIRQRYQLLNKQLPDDVLQLLNKEQLSELAGLAINHDGLFFPHAGWVSPPSFCQALVDYPGITVKTGVSVDRLTQTHNSWLLKHEGSTLMEAAVVILAGGLSTNHFIQVSHLPLKGIRGQITQITATEQSAKLKSVICGEGYVAPSYQSSHTLGATFDFNNEDLTVNAADHNRNLAMQSEWFPAFNQAIGKTDGKVEGGKAGFRTTTPDYLPLVGPIFDKTAFLKDFALLRKNRKHPFQQSPAWLNGLYISAGHGSRGLITCPLAGEILASIINDDPYPISQALANELNPSRFLVRDLSRNKI